MALTVTPNQIRSIDSSWQINDAVWDSSNWSVELSRYLGRSGNAGEAGCVLEGFNIEGLSWDSANIQFTVTAGRYLSRYPGTYIETLEDSIINISTSGSGSPPLDFGISATANLLIYLRFNYNSTPPIADRPLELPQTFDGHDDKPDQQAVDPLIIKVGIYHSGTEVLDDPSWSEDRDETYIGVLSYQTNASGDLISVSIQDWTNLMVYGYEYFMKGTNLHQKHSAIDGGIITESWDDRYEHPWIFDIQDWGTWNPIIYSSHWQNTHWTAESGSWNGTQWEGIYDATTDRYILDLKRSYSWTDNDCRPQYIRMKIYRSDTGRLLSDEASVTIYDDYGTSGNNIVGSGLIKGTHTQSYLGNGDICYLYQFSENIGIHTPNHPRFFDRIRVSVPNKNFVVTDMVFQEHMWDSEVHTTFGYNIINLRARYNWTGEPGIPIDNWGDNSDYYFRPTRLKLGLWSDDPIQCIVRDNSGSIIGESGGYNLIDGDTIELNNYRIGSVNSTLSNMEIWSEAASSPWILKGFAFGDNVNGYGMNLWTGYPWV